MINWWPARCVMRYVPGVFDFGSTPEKRFSRRPRPPERPARAAALSVGARVWPERTGGLRCLDRRWILGRRSLAECRRQYEAAERDWAGRAGLAGTQEFIL